MTKRYIFLTGILCVYSILVIFGGIHHEPWRDEAHTWYASRESSLPDLFNSDKNAGVPVLWDLVIFPFAKIGLPYEAMTFVHIVIAIVAVGLLLFFGKVPLPVKILFTFSYYMTYEYAVIARHYVLDILLLFAIAYVYANRIKKPIRYGILVALLYQVNVYGIVTAGALMLVFAIEIWLEKCITRRSIFALSLMMFTALVTFIMLVKNPTLHEAVNPGYLNFQEQLTNTVFNLVIPTLNGIVFNLISYPLFYNLTVFLSSITILLSIVLISRSRTVLFLALVTYGWQIYINTVIHLGQPRHHGLILIFLLFFWWIFNTKKYRKNYLSSGIETVLVAVLSALLIISIFYTVNTYAFDYQYPFSGAKDAALFIKNNNLENMIVVSHQGALGEAVLPYFKNKQFYFPEFKKQGFFNLNNGEHAKLENMITPQIALSWATNNFPETTPVLLLWSLPIPDDSLTRFTLLHTSLANHFWAWWMEDFFLYANKSAMKQISLQNTPTR